MKTDLTIILKADIKKTWGVMFPADLSEWDITYIHDITGSGLVVIFKWAL